MDCLKVKTVSQFFRFLLFSLAVGFGFAAPTCAAEYYVSSAAGLDSNSGLSMSTPFKTLQKAADITHPGDTVYALSGTYTDTNNPDVINIRTSGTASAPITFRNYKGQTPKIQLSTNNWRGVNIAAGVKYIVIDGFEIAGINQSLTWKGASAARESGLGIPLYHGTGVCCNGTFDSATKAINPVSHIVVENCKIHDCGEEGFGSLQSDYLTIKNNVIWNCSWYSSYNGSGISTCENANVDNNTADYKIIITGNKVYNCAAYIGSMQIKWSLTDGNGIIIDDADCRGTSQIAYAGKTLVADNLVYHCGGRGINVGSSNNVDVINNTLYHNATSFPVANVHIAAGGNAASPFVADAGFTGGATDSPWDGPVDTSLINGVAIAPQAVYHNERFGTSPDGFKYTIHVKPLCSYRIILHFTEDKWNEPNKRQFNVSINDNRWLNNFDIFAAAAALHKAVAEVALDTSDPDGNIVIGFTPGAYDVPKVDAVEVIPDYFAPSGEICFDSSIKPTGMYHCYGNICWPIAGEPAITQYNVDPSQINLDYNLYYDSSGSHPAVAFTDKNAVWSDPRLKSPGIGADADFQLLPDSSAINSGGNFDTHSSTDLSGKSRVVGGAVDIGAYEYQGKTLAVPKLTSIKPASANDGAKPVHLTAAGSGFRNTSRINWNGVPLPTKYVSPSSLQTVVPADDLAWAGTQNITIYTPSGGSSEAKPFNITSTDTSQFNFEDGTQGWDSNKDAVSGIETSTAKAFAGMRSLAVNLVNSTPANFPAISASTNLPPAGATLQFHIWIPAGFPLDWCQVGANTTAGAGRYFGFTHSLTPGQWTTLTVPIPANAGTITNLACQWHTSASFTGTVYFDTVTW